MQMRKENRFELRTLQRTTTLLIGHFNNDFGLNTHIRYLFTSGLHAASRPDPALWT